MKNKSQRPVIAVPPGMAQWVEKEAGKLGIVFMAEIAEIDPTHPGHDVENETTVPPSSPSPLLRPV